MTNFPLDLSFTQDPIWREQRQKQYAKLLEALDELTKRDAKILEKYFVDGDFSGIEKFNSELLTQIEYFPLKTPAAWDYIITRNGPLENPINIASHIYTVMTQSLAPVGWTPEEINSFADYMGITDTSEVIAPTVFERLGVGVAEENPVPTGQMGLQFIYAIFGLTNTDDSDYINISMFFLIQWRWSLFVLNNPLWSEFIEDPAFHRKKEKSLSKIRAIFNVMLADDVPILCMNLQPYFIEMKVGLLEALRAGNLPQVLLDEVADLRERA